MSKFYRVVTFQSKEVVDVLLQNELYLADINKLREGSICEEDIKACGGKTPIWVFQHPAFCFEGIGIRQFCDMMRTFKEEMSVSTLKEYCMIELHLAKQPPVGAAYNDYTCACVIPEINLDDVAAIYKVVSSGANCIYALDVVKMFKDNTLFKDNVSFDYDMQMNDRLPTLSLAKFKSVNHYYIYESVLYAYVLSIVGNARTDLLITDILNELPKHELGLVELYDEVTKIINTKQVLLSESSIENIAMKAISDMNK